MEVNDDSTLAVFSEMKPIERSKRAKIGDCVIIFMIWIVAVIFELQLLEISPHRQYIPGLDDNDASTVNFTFAYPDIDASLDDLALLLITAVPWYIILVISSICLYQKQKDSFSFYEWREQFYLLHRMVFFCTGTALLVTDSMKLFVGAARPYSLEAHHKHTSGDIDTSKLNQSYLSFPSGHASLSMSSLLLLSMRLYESWKYAQNMSYNASCLIGTKTDNPHAYYLYNVWWLLRYTPLFGILLVFSPTYIAIYCGLTRIVDYKHFEYDVNAGFVIGACISYVTFLPYYNECYSKFEHKLQIKIETNKLSKDQNLNDLSDLDENDAVAIHKENKMPADCQ